MHLSLLHQITKWKGNYKHTLHTVATQTSKPLPYPPPQNHHETTSKPQRSKPNLFPCVKHQKYKNRTPHIHTPPMQPTYTHHIPSPYPQVTPQSPTPTGVPPMHLHKTTRITTMQLPPWTYHHASHEPPSHHYNSLTSKPPWKVTMQAPYTTTKPHRLGFMLTRPFGAANAAWNLVAASPSTSCRRAHLPHTSLCCEPSKHHHHHTTYWNNPCHCPRFDALLPSLVVASTVVHAALPCKTRTRASELSFKIIKWSLSYKT